MTSELRADQVATDQVPAHDELPIADLIGRGLIERCYGAPYDPAGIHVRADPFGPPAEVIDLRDARDASRRVSPREARARWRVFRSYWLGHLCSMVGDHITLVALPMAAQRLTGSGLVVGLIVSAETVATVVFGTAAGTYTDRRDPRPVMIATDLGRAVLLALIAALAWHGHAAAAILVAASFALGLMRLMHDGAESVMVARLVPDEHDVRSNARLTLSENIGLTLGPLIAGAATGVGVWLAFGLDAITFLAAAVAVAVVSRLSQRRHILLAPDAEDVGASSRFRDEFRSAFRAIRHQKAYFRSLVVLTVVNIAALPLGPQLVSLAHEELGLNDAMVGVLFAVGGVSGIVAAPLVERGTTIRPALVLVGGGLLSGGVLLVGLYPSVATVVLAMVVAGVGLAMALTHHAALRQRVFPPRLQGRVALTSRMVLWSAIPVGAVAGGWLSDHAGPAAMWLACGAAGIAVSAWGGAAGLWRVRLS